MTDFALMLQGIVILPDRILPNGYVAVADGRIAEVGQGHPPSARESHHLGAALILPGAIDAQVHSLSQRDQEDFIWSTRAAAAGGVTTIVDMPYDEGDLICSAAAVKRKIAHAGKQARVDFALYGTIDPDRGGRANRRAGRGRSRRLQVLDLWHGSQALPAYPAAADGGVFRVVAPTGLTAGVHNEDDEYVRASLAKVKAAGITDWRAHGLSRPPLTELLAMTAIYEIGAATGCPAHVVHCSLGRGYEIAASYKAQGYAATAECLIHYLMLDEENDARRLGGRSKCNPPLRPRAEVEKLWRRLAAGDVDLVSTDHVSWSLDRKTDPDMLANASGLPGLETMAPLFVKGALDRGVPLTWMAKLMAENPAKHFRLDHIKGALRPGRDADIMVLTPESHVVDTAKSGNSVAGWSPFDGMALPYKVAATYARGRLAFDGAKVLAEPGTGHFVRPPERIPVAGQAA